MRDIKGEALGWLARGRASWKRQDRLPPPCFVFTRRATISQRLSQGFQCGLCGLGLFTAARGHWHGLGPRVSWQRARVLMTCVAHPLIGLYYLLRRRPTENAA